VLNTLNVKMQVWVGIIFGLLSSVYGLNNGLARLPPMGWMSWSRFFCEIDCVAHPNGCINEALYKVHADKLVSDGFKDVGYNHIHIDDCWSEKARDSSGRLVADKTRFFSGILALSEYMHQRGILLGIYGDVGTTTCAGYPASQGHEEIDAETFASWNVDYLKFDGCNTNISDLRKDYPLFYSKLNLTGSQIIYSCEWPLYEEEQKFTSNYTQISDTCNVFRNYHDVANNWGSVSDIIKYYVENQEKFIPYNGPGSWFDPDMLVIGNGLTVKESRSQMAIWSIWSAPLIMSNDLRVLEKNLRDILQNKGVIAVDQDPLGIMGKMVKSSDDIYVFVKPMTPFETATNKSNSNNYSYAILCFNNAAAQKSISFKFADLGLNYQNGYDLVDLWSGEKIGNKKPNDTYTVNVAGHDSLIFKATISNHATSHRFL
jgi:hypothetical protein